MGYTTQVCLLATLTADWRLTIKVIFIQAPAPLWRVVFPPLSVFPLRSSLDISALVKTTLSSKCNYFSLSLSSSSFCLLNYRGKSRVEKGERRLFCHFENRRPIRRTSFRARVFPAISAAAPPLRSAVRPPLRSFTKVFSVVHASRMGSNL